MRQIAEGVWCSGMTSVIEGRESLTLIDPGFEGAVGPDLQAGGRAAGVGDSVAEILAFGLARRKPLAHLIITHSHVDHIAYLQDYLQAAAEAGTIPRLIAHANTPLHHEAMLLVTREGDQHFDGVDYTFLPCGGHSREEDELAVFLPRAGVLFVGDQCQPQGESYTRCDGPSPVPLFYDGRAYIESLVRLNAVPFRWLQLGHGHTLSKAPGRQALEVTLQVVRRIEVLAHKLVAENGGEAPDTFCRWIYDTIGFERGFAKERADARRENRFYNQWTEYQIFDRPGIAYFVFEALESVGNRGSAAATTEMIREVHRIWERQRNAMGGSRSTNSAKERSAVARALAHALGHEAEAERALREAIRLAENPRVQEPLEGLLQADGVRDQVLRQILAQQFGIEIA